MPSKNNFKLGIYESIYAQRIIKFFSWILIYINIWIVWIISTTAAFYTHYYAGIYCAVMALSIAPLIPKKNIYRFLWILPFGLFLIWTPFFINTITLQSKLHWTYGTASIGDSIGGMFSGLIDILTGPRQSAPSSIRLFANDIGDIYEPFPPAAEINPTNLSFQD